MSVFIIAKTNGYTAVSVNKQYAWEDVKLHKKARFRSESGPANIIYRTGYSTRRNDRSSMNQPLLAIAYLARRAMPTVMVLGSSTVNV